MTGERSPETIVVGVDGSASGRVAARWALHHARSGDMVHFVHAWSSGAPIDPSGGERDHRTEAELIVRHELDHFRSMPRDDDVVLAGRVVEGHAVDVLSMIEADLVVIGTDSPVERGRSNVVSVPARLVRTSGTPVVVVPHSGSRA